MQEEFEVLPPVLIGASAVSQVKHRRSHRLLFFYPMDNSGEMLYCSCIFDVHWLKLASYQCRNLNTLGIEYVRSGSLVGQQNGREYRVGPGEIFLMRPGTESSIRTGPEGYCVKTSLGLYGDLLPHILLHSGLDHTDLITRIDQECFELLLEKFGELAGECPSNVRRKNGTLSYELLHFLQYPHADPKMPKRFDTLPEYIDHNLSQPLELQIIAGMANCSVNHLIREFQKYFGCTPGRYIAARRIRRAAELLITEPELSIKEIAYRSGYQSQLNFSTAFKHHFASSPSQYRRHHLPFHAIL